MHVPCMVSNAGNTRLEEQMVRENSTLIDVIDEKCRYVSAKEWPLESFSRYCSGSAFILSRDLIPRMAYNAVRTKFFWVELLFLCSESFEHLQIDDFYITGLLLAPLNTTYISLASLYVLKANEMQVKHFVLRQN